HPRQLHSFPTRRSSDLAALLIYGQVDTVLLSLLTNDAVVGWYVAAYRFIGIPAFVPVILLTVAFPALAASQGSATFKMLARRVLDRKSTRLNSSHVAIS